MKSPEPEVEALDTEAATEGHPTVHVARLSILGGLVAALWWWQGWQIVAVIGAILVFIFFHELGHYLAARHAGMKVTEFFIGFGPRIFSFKRGEVEYGVKAIPAGAYVRIIGMVSIDEVPPEDEERTYRRKPFRQRLLVAVAGSGMHFIMAIVLLWIAFGAIGRTDERHWAVANPTPGSAAAVAGIVSGDRVVAVRSAEGADPGFSIAVGTHEAMSKVVRQHPDEDVRLVVANSAGVRRTVAVRLGVVTGIYGTVAQDIRLGLRDGELRVNSVGTSGVVHDAGLREGDLITAVAGRPVSTLDDLKAAVAAVPGGSVRLDVDRDGVRSVHTVDLGRSVKLDVTTGFLGVGQRLVPQEMGVLAAGGAAFAEFGRFVGTSVGQVARLPLRVVDVVDRAFHTTPGQGAQTDKPETAKAAAQQSATSNANRPLSIVGAVSVGGELARDGWLSILRFLAGFNIIIGLFNLIPLLPLDGGHVAVACYEKIRELARGGRERYLADARKLLPVAYAVVTVLIVMGLAALYLDLADPIRI